MFISWYNFILTSNFNSFAKSTYSQVARPKKRKKQPFSHKPGYPVDKLIQLSMIKCLNYKHKKHLIGVFAVHF